MRRRIYHRLRQGCGMEAKPTAGASATAADPLPGANPLRRQGRKERISQRTSRETSVFDERRPCSANDRLLAWPSFRLPPMPISTESVGGAPTVEPRHAVKARHVTSRPVTGAAGGAAIADTRCITNLQRPTHSAPGPNPVRQPLARSQAVKLTQGIRRPGQFLSSESGLGNGRILRSSAFWEVVRNRLRIGSAPEPPSRSRTSNS